jgi:hypothetical protein
MTTKTINIKSNQRSKTKAVAAVEAPFIWNPVSILFTLRRKKERADLLRE